MSTNDSNEKVYADYLEELEATARDLDAGSRSELLGLVRQHFADANLQGLDAQTSIENLGSPGKLVSEVQSESAAPPVKARSSKIVWAILLTLALLWLLTAVGIAGAWLLLGAGQGWLLITGAFLLICSLPAIVVSSRKLRL